MKKIIKLGLLIIMGITLFGCTHTPTLNDILKENNYIVVDVRTKEEYLSGHIKDAINIPYDEITSDINLDKDKTILVYCQSGRRSSVAHDKLKEMGYSVYNLGSYNEIDMEKE